MIWEYAAIPRGQIELSGRFLALGCLYNDANGEDFFKRVSKKKFPDPTIIGNLDWVVERRRVGLTAHARSKLMRICTLSRQVMLETWKNDVDAALFGHLSHDDTPILLKILGGVKIRMYLMCLLE